MKNIINLIYKVQKHNIQFLDHLMNLLIYKKKIIYYKIILLKKVYKKIKIKNLVQKNHNHFQ